MTEPSAGDATLMTGPGALPRENGELIFSAPWQGRALALAIALVNRLELPWDAFRECLIAAIVESPERPYYESWVSALEDLVVGQGLTTSEGLDAATPSERPVL